MRKKLKSGIVIGSVQPRARLSKRKRLALLASAAVVIIGGAALGAFLLLRDQAEPAPALYTQTEYKQVQTELDNRTAAPERTDTDKAELYIAKAQAAIAQKNYADALTAAQAAQKLQPKDVQTLQLIASIYTKQGNKDAAIRYYRQAIRLTDSPQLKQYYQQRIDALNK